MTLILTKRQAEALWAAREVGNARLLANSNNVGGSSIRMLRMLRDVGLLTGQWTITRDGLATLAAYENAHPRMKLHPWLLPAARKLLQP